MCVKQYKLIKKFNLEGKRLNLSERNYCICGHEIPEGYGYYNFGNTLKCFWCGKINKKIDHLPKI